MNITTHYKIFTKAGDRYDRLTIILERLGETFTTLLEIGEPFEIRIATKLGCGRTEGFIKYNGRILEIETGNITETGSGKKFRFMEETE